jgi:hypothetical protein
MSLIRNSKKVTQAIDFTGLQNGNIHPSDIDVVLEFDNRVLILMEVKHEFNKIPTGQRLLLERLCNSWHTPENAIVLKVEHNFNDDDSNIPLEKCWVTRTYFKSQWTTFEEPYNLIDYVNNLGETWNCKKCKF